VASRFWTHTEMAREKPNPRDENNSSEVPRDVGESASCKAAFELLA